MLLSELVARRELGLRVLHGTAADLDRSVRWVYTTDLPDPSRYLGGGELVISGLVWRRSAADSERFVAAVAAAGAAALAAGEAVFGDVPDDVVDACRRYGLVLIAVPEHVSFGAVTETVVGALSAARGDRLAHTLGRHRRLLAAFAEGADLTDLAGSVSAGTGLTCRVLTAGGALLAGPPLPADDRDAVVAAFLTAERLPVTAARHLVVPAAPGTARTTSWLVAAELPPGREADTEAVDAVGELAAIAALDRSRRREGTAVARSIADDALARIAGGEGDRPETRARLRQAGVEPDGTLVVLVLRADDDADPAGTAYALLVDALAGAGPAAVGVHGGAAVAVLAVPGADAAPDAGPVADPVAGVLDRLHRLGPGLAGRRLCAGVGHPSSADALSGALGEAGHAAELAAHRPGPVAAVRAGEITSHVALLAGVPDEVRRGFAAQVLGPVLDHDARSGAGLADTLATFLDESGSWSRTAARLHLHVNTVRYRIGRVEALTGRDLGSFPDRVDLYLALRSR
ncbi:PucR family transcriptional regulator ligand-binding domain-containing protein [Pseudonocardia sp. C8]|uniref:PucR family transcriptional regulator n=1 Tax=Pseudonocardia sp. C8 TaxID=2762759 RepID=UPI0016427D8B|nr:PucR family transcriptional regulator ligand-binding domain-containing protein [Pseudonocardia sp. C8]MBC3192455.1 PucR family transcriptional regulator ligand-binding domain-containing protein [Pseudonocardia sp. C8]